MRYLLTLRVVLGAPDEVEAHLLGNDIAATLAKDFLEDEDTIDITQVLPLDVPLKVEPTEMVDQLNRTVDLLIATRVIQCIDFARELDKIRYIIEHRAEATFDVSGYSYGDFQDRVDKILKRGPYASPA